MQLSSLLGHTAELVRIIRKSPQPADGLASEYFRSKKYLGSTDRRFISGLVFHTLRTLALCEAVREHCGLDDVAHAGHLLMEPQDEVDLSFINDLPEHVRVNTQEWLLHATRERWPADASDVWRSMMSPAPLVLRVNLRRADRAGVIARLRADGITCEPGAYAPAAIVVHQRVNLLQHGLYLDGIIEVQDEGSQLVGHACAVGPRDTVLDACAGAGGKTLHLADLQGDAGTIVAHDVEWQRLKEIPTRARRAGLRSIQVLAPGSLLAAPQRGGRRPKHNHTRPLPRIPSTFDLVLLDAPCSGLGTVRRMPMVKWRITPELLERHARKQLLVMEQYVPYVADGGVLVYATCSIMPQENEHVVERFLAAHPEFVLEPIPWSTTPDIPATLAQQGASGMFQADPFHHGTDGLFVGRLRRG